MLGLLDAWARGIFQAAVPASYTVRLIDPPGP